MILQAKQMRTNARCNIVKQRRWTKPRNSRIKIVLMQYDIKQDRVFNLYTWHYFWCDPKFLVFLSKHTSITYHWYWLKYICLVQVSSYCVFVSGGCNETMRSTHKVFRCVRKKTHPLKGVRCAKKCDTGAITPQKEFVFWAEVPWLRSHSISVLFQPIRRMPCRPLG